ncbi:MAG: amidohydrolase [Chloroflexi bacterium]|nr:amidohydrolase [Chloroflexota bacterium]
MSDQTPERSPMQSGALIDTHTHVVADDQEKYPLTPGYPASWFTEVPVSAERLQELMGPAGVDRAVLVQGFGPYGFENSYAADSARSRPERFSSVCVVDYDDDPVGRLTYWVKERGARGVRFMPPRTGADAAWLEDPARDDLWRCAIALNVPILVQIQPVHIPGLRKAMARFPDTPIALDHCGFPDFSGGPPYEKARALFELAEFRNIHLKVTSNVLQLAGADGRDPLDFMRRLGDTFGAERLMWGSDYSQTHNLSYAELAELGRHASSVLSSDGQEWYRRKTALKFWPELGGDA